MQFFKDLGSLIEQRWKDRNYDESVFPELAAQALVETAPDQRVSPWEIIEWLFTATDIPGQQDIPGKFGDPPITLFSGPRFHIDIYFWLDGTTSIHQHAFCGAFHVLLGSSIHSHYSFRDRRLLNQHFAVGRTVLESVELLEQGAVKRILPGDQYIHSLFHLDRPSATICVRTYHTASGSPQYNYHKPCFAIDPFFTEPLSTKQLQSASMLLRIKHPEADARLGDLIARSDFQAAFNLLDLARGYMAGDQLEQSFGLNTGEDRFQNLVEIARRRHGDLVDLISPIFEEAQRQNNLINRRAQITTPEHRFFLALLLNVPDGTRLLEMVEQRFPDREPVETALDWVEELAHTKVMGASEANVLGINDFDDDYLLVLRCMLEGLSPEETVGAFEKEFSADYAAGLDDKPARLYQAIRDSMLFKSIFRDMPAPMNAEKIDHHQPASA
jgi:hypothetical protein